MCLPRFVNQNEFALYDGVEMKIYQSGWSARLYTP